VNHHFRNGAGASGTRPVQLSFVEKLRIHSLIEVMSMNLRLISFSLAAMPSVKSNSFWFGVV
jgi:hypothetical protein